MIDFEDMEARQLEGVTRIDSLQEDEKEILRHYCSLFTEVLLKEGAQRKVPVDKLVANAFRFGIGLGTRLTIAGGEIRGR